MELIALTFVVSFVTSILSGFAGGGGGFLLTPYYIFIGLTPQQAIATGKFGGVGVALGALSAFRGRHLVDKRYVWPLMIITILCALLAAWLLPNLDGELLQQVIGIMLLVLIPTLFINKAALAPGDRSKTAIAFGYFLATFIILAQTMAGSGVGTLLVIVLMLFFGLDALQASATKRSAQLAQAALLSVLLFLQGLVIIGHAIAGLIGSFIGCHIGSKVAIKKGESFVKLFLAIMMAAAGLILLFGV